MNLPPRLEACHLLHHHIGCLTEGAGEDAGVLEDGGLPFVEAVRGGDAAGDVHDAMEATLFVADQVVGAAGGLQTVNEGSSVGVRGPYIGEGGTGSYSG